MSEDEQAAAAVRYAESRDRKRPHLLSRNKLIQQHLPMIRSSARKIYTANRRHAGFDDLVDAGVVGMIEGLRRFDPSLGHKVGTYCLWWAKCEMHKYVKQMRWPWAVSEGDYRDLMKFNRTFAKLPPSFDEVRDLESVPMVHDGKNLSARLVRKCVALSRLTISLEVPVTRDGRLKLSETIDDRHVMNAEENTVRQRAIGLIEKGMEALTSQERSAVMSYFFDAESEPVVPDDPKKVSDAERYLRKKALKKLQGVPEMRRALDTMNEAEVIRAERNRQGRNR